MIALVLLVVLWTTLVALFSFEQGRRRARSGAVNEVKEVADKLWAKEMRDIIEAVDRGNISVKRELERTRAVLWKLVRKK